VHRQYPQRRDQDSLRLLLPDRSTLELKQMWRDLCDKELPGFSRNYLISRLAYRIQELAYGGLKPATRARLDALADALDPKPARKRLANGPVVGTQLIREWRGVEQKVTVLADGFEWEGRRYKSLSAAARAITGTRWNGLTFFGVKRHGGGTCARGPPGSFAARSIPGSPPRKA
jgi:hypothetical protein